MPHISSREEFQKYLITIIIIIIVIIIIIIDYFYAINACKFYFHIIFGYKWLVCCLTGYYQPNRDDDVYYWQPVPSPCFIVIFFVSRKSMHGANEVVVVFF